MTASPNNSVDFPRAGGVRSTLTDVTALDNPSYNNGVEVYVISTNQHFRLDLNSSATIDGSTVLARPALAQFVNGLVGAPSPLPGRWLLESSGGGASFYQVVESSGLPHPQRAALNFDSGFVIIDDALNNDTEIVSYSVPPFRAVYHVDPTFTGIQLGSESNPFTTCAIAFAAALAIGLVTASVKLSPGCILSENVVFPTVGNDWEILCDHGAAGSVAATINGSVTAITAGAVRYRLSDLRVVGNISGSSVGNSQLVLSRVIASANVAMTGNWAAVIFIGKGTVNLDSLGGNVIGTVSVAGPIFASQYTFASAIDYSAIGTVFFNCRFGTSAFTLNGSGTINTTFYDCQFVTALTFTSANNNTIFFDGTSMQNAFIGITFSGAGAFTVKTLNANQSILGLFNGNIGVTDLTQVVPAGLYEAVATEDLITQGTSGNAVLNIIYVGLDGLTKTLPVTTALDITSAIGTETRGSVIFRHNGGAKIQYSLTGIVTPGPLVGNLGIAVMKRD